MFVGLSTTSKSMQESCQSSEGWAKRVIEAARILAETGEHAAS
jgi:hypothetical protein